MTRLRRAAVPALLLALLSAAPAIAAPPDRHGDPVLLALGDSVAAGIGAVPGARGYPELVGASLADGYHPRAGKATPNASTQFEVVNLAEPGATTVELASQVAQAVALIEEQRADRDPKNDVEVITLTIGGNDLFRPVVAACVLPATTACQQATDVALAGVRSRLTAALAELTAAAGKHVEVVVTTYYNPVGSCALTLQNSAAPAIAEVALEGGTLVAASEPDATVPDLVLRAGLNDVLREVAAATGAQVAELHRALDEDDYVGGADCLHPNARGHAVIAKQVVQTLSR